eukprot:2514774-Pyramimonas_sp.AAC.1
MFRIPPLEPQRSLQQGHGRDLPTPSFSRHGVAVRFHATGASSSPRTFTFNKMRPPGGRSTPSRGSTHIWSPALVIGLFWQKLESSAVG